MISTVSRESAPRSTNLASAATASRSVPSCSEMIVRTFSRVSSDWGGGKGEQRRGERVSAGARKDEHRIRSRARREARKRLRPARDCVAHGSRSTWHRPVRRVAGPFGSRMCLHRRFRGRGRRDRGRGRGGGIRTAAAKTPKWALAKTAGRALRAAVGRARNCTCGVREINRIAQREGGWEEKASGGWAPGRRSAARFVASMPFGIARSTREARAETPRRDAPDARPRRGVRWRSG